MKRILLLCLVLLAPSASAHVEFLPGEGANVNESIWLGPKPPAREHRDLPQHGGIRYYSIDLQANETVRIRLYRNTASFTSGIPPSLAIIGPELAPRGFAPAFLQKPEGMHAQVWQGIYTPAVEYHPAESVARSPLVDTIFTPPTKARYHIAVFDEDDGGAFALQIGEYPVISWRSFAYTPREATELREWEGQSFAHTTLPGILGTVAGAALVILFMRARPERRLPSTTVFSLGAGVLIFASSVSYSHQAIHHRALGLATIASTIALATAGYAVATSFALNAIRIRTRPTKTHRTIAAFLGLAGLLLWSGFLWGPLAAILGAILPDEETPSPAPDR